MKRNPRRQPGKSAFDLIEEATHLLRTAPAATLARYFLGAIPFVLGLLFFWADMSRSPLASQHLAAASLGMAALFCWMKFWQVLFTRRIRAQAAGAPPPPLSLRSGLRILFVQTVIQPSGLFLLPLALLPVLPFGWVYAFYQNAAALDDGAETGALALLKDSRRQAALWPGQNHLLLLILAAFAGCMFLNWISVCLLLPELCKMLLGVESIFTKSPMAMLNSTFFAAMAGLTYLCVDPLLKTIYALRCFYGQSLESGEDLKAELQPFLQNDRNARIAAALLLFFALIFVPPALADSPAPAGSAAAVRQALPPPDLDQAISQTIHQRKYVWRMPREQVVEPESKEGVVAQFFDTVGTMIHDALHAAKEWLAKLWRKLFPHRPPEPVQTDTSGYSWILSLQVLLYGLVAAALSALAIFLYRFWRNRRRRAAPVASEAIPTVPDVADENVRADQLPEDGWTKLARELLERGEFRLAMRAFYLASLSQLAARNLISIARFKSNRDYERELRRRAHAFPGLLDVFGDNLSVFERIWYGMHEASRDTVNQFAANLERLKGGG